MDRSSKYAVGASVPLLLGAGSEIARVAFDVPWRGLVEPSSQVISVVLAAFFATAAAALILRRQSALWAQAAWVLALVSPAVMFLYALMTHVLGNPIGLGYLVGAAVTGFCVKRTFDRGERFRMQEASLAGAHAAR